MAIEQNSTITVGSGADARTFGISKSLDNYSIDELLGIGDWAYSAYNDSEMNANIYSEINTSGTMIDITDGQYASRVVCYPDNQLMSKGYNTNSEGVFFRNVLIYYDVTETNWAASSVNIDAGRFPHYYVVTDIDLQDLVINALSDPNAVVSTYSTMKLGVNDVTIAPFQLYIDQNGILSLNMILPPVGCRNASVNPNSDLVCFSVTYGNWSVYNGSTGWGRNIKNQLPYHFFSPNHVDYPFQDSRIPGTQVLTDADKLIQCVKTDAPNIPARFHYQYKVDLMDLPYIDSARCGIRFKIGDTVYKPIVEDGMITGYTDDDTVQSEWDAWETITDHVTPSERPVPPSPSGDDLDDIDLSAALYGAGMAHYYICTKASGVLNTISEAMGNLRFSEAGTNLFPNLISCKLFPSGTGAVPALNSTFKIAGKELLDPDDEQPIQIQEVTGSPSIIIEDISIDRKFGDFRDYAPYTMIELYVPFCGWTALPSWSMGGTVSGKIIIDIIDGSCKAVIEVTKNGKKTPVAELSGCCSLDIPFTAENVGAKMAGIMSAMSASATAALESAVGVGTMTVTGGKSGGKSVVSGLTSYAASLCQATLVNNQNYTQVTGRTGDGCNLGGVTDIVLKIQRPNTTEYSAPLYVPDGFAHAIGFMSMKQKKVSECTGLIICDNVDTSGIGGATDEERAEIKRVLETGLYVNAAPE